MKYLNTVVCFVCLAGWHGTTIAEPQKIRPGLWEHSFEVGSDSGQVEAAMAEAKEAMAAMPAEQRKMIEQMMKERGISTDMNTTTVKVCITKEQAENYALPQKDNCTQKIEQAGDDSLKMTFNCAGNPPSSGKGEMHILSDKAYSGEFEVTTTVMGKPDTLQAKQSGRWLSDDCGDIKPAL